MVEMLESTLHRNQTTTAAKNDALERRLPQTYTTNLESFNRQETVRGSLRGVIVMRRQDKVNRNLWRSTLLVLLIVRLIVAGTPVMASCRTPSHEAPAL